jgi:hypothetical protein
MADNKLIFYIRSHAFTNCDCGKEIGLAQRTFGSKKYDGSCICGKEWELLNGKIKSKDKK